MSHYALMIRLGDIALEHAEDVISEKIEPYEEGGRTSFHEFKDCTDEARDEWENDTVDEAYRVDGVLKFSCNTDEKEKSNSEKLEDVPIQEFYKNFDDFCRTYHGYEKRGDRYGYLHNPSAKWDWWVIGGRYSGYVPVKPDAEGLEGRPGVFGNEVGKDIFRKKDIDFDKVAENTKERVDSFMAEWKEACEGEWDPKSFGGWRMSMINMGLVECKDLDEIDYDDDSIVIREWSGDKERADIVHANTPEKELYDKAYTHLNDLKPYAFLDEEWVEPGEMGWFGIDSSTEESHAEYTEQFEKWFGEIGEDEVLAIVDCHI